MATEDRYIATREGAGIACHNRVSRNITLTVNGNTTVKDSTIVLPAGSIQRGVQIETATAISGTPTTCNVRVGLTDTAQDVVADVDAKAQGHIAATIVAALDKKGSFSAADTTLFIQVTTAGGTSAAGSIVVIVDYDAPRF